MEPVTTTSHKRKKTAKSQKTTYRRGTLRARRVRRWRALGVLGPPPVKRQRLVLVLREPGGGGLVGLRPVLPLAARGAEAAQGKGLARGGGGGLADALAKGAQRGQGGSPARVGSVLGGGQYWWHVEHRQGWWKGNGGKQMLQRRLTKTAMTVAGETGKARSSIF